MSSSDQITRIEVSFPSGPETIVGDLVLPPGDGPHPVVLSVEGTGQQNRHGDHIRPDGTPEPRTRQRWVGERLAAAGIAQLCWDKRGVGASTGGDRSPGDPPGIRDAHASPRTDVEDLLSALAFLRRHPSIDPRRITVMGTSAGVYFTCRAAAHTDIPASYILWGGVHMPIEDLAAAIYGLPLAYAARGQAERDWLLANNPDYYRLALQWPHILDAARAGAAVYEWEDDGGEHRTYLERMKQEMADPYPEQFANITAPVMVIHGDRDLNVDVSEAFAAADALRTAGNPDVTLCIVPGATHEMRLGPADLSEDERLRDRFIRHRNDPLSEYFLLSVIGWIRDTWVRYGLGAEAESMAADGA